MPLLIRDDQAQELHRFLEQTRFARQQTGAIRFTAYLAWLKMTPTQFRYPDYRRSTADLYTDLAFKLISYQKNLNILSTYERKDPSSGIPTWAPNWASPSNDEEDYLKFCPRISCFRAGPNSGDAARLCGNRVLATKGVDVDTVSQIIGPFQRQTRNPEAIVAELARVVGLNRRPTALDLQDNCLYEIFSSTMLGGLVAGASHGETFNYVTFRRTNAFDAYYLQFASAMWNEDPSYLCFIDSRSDVRSTELIVRIMTMDVLPEQKRELSLYWITESFWLAKENRMFFKTDQGRIGFRPPDICLGDCVFAVRGANMPLILRPTATPDVETIPRLAVDGYCYYLVGYCYVHGIMDGEAVMGRGLHELFLV